MGDEIGNGFFDKMTEQAMKEVSAGDKGWKECDPNALMLACFGNFTKAVRSLMEQQKQLIKALWFLSTVLASALIGNVLVDLFN